MAAQAASGQGQVREVLSGRSAEQTIIHGDCLEVMRGMGADSLDAVITDPPYAEVARPYGRWTEREWFDLMDPVVEEIRRLLKPSGSAVFILQPNSERVGKMRPWFFEFMAKWAREWNLVQDVWWWNHAAMPCQPSMPRYGLTRPSIKACVWLGPPDCYRNQDAVLWTESDANKAARLSARALRASYPSGHSRNPATATGAAVARGGVTPFNLLPIPNTNSATSGGAHGHGAATPLPLCSWWVRYIGPPEGRLLDPFAGSGSTGVACALEGVDFIGIEREAEYVEIARKRIAGVGRDAKLPLG